MSRTRLLLVVEGERLNCALLYAQRRCQATRFTYDEGISGQVGDPGRRSRGTIQARAAPTRARPPGWVRGATGRQAVSGSRPSVARDLDRKLVPGHSKDPSSGWDLQRAAGPTSPQDDKVWEGRFAQDDKVREACSGAVSRRMTRFGGARSVRRRDDKVPGDAGSLCRAGRRGSGGEIGLGSRPTPSRLGCRSAARALAERPELSRRAAFAGGTSTNDTSDASERLGDCFSTQRTRDLPSSQ